MSFKDFGDDFVQDDKISDDEEEALEKVNQDNDYYAFLHVPRNASQEEITASYRKYCRWFHPDKHRDEAKKEHAKALFEKLQEAYAVLSDPHKRAIYDCLGNFANLGSKLK